MHSIGRRDFLQTSTAILAGALLAPKNLFARNPDDSSWFLQVETQT